MAKFIKEYPLVECLEVDYGLVAIDAKILNRKRFISQVGTLLIFESERLTKGKKWVKFISNKDFLQTSPGDIEIKNDVLTLKTHNGEHIYKFKIRKE